jgi:hypothetical protein
MGERERMAHGGPLVKPESCRACEARRLFTGTCPGVSFGIEDGVLHTPDIKAALHQIPDLSRKDFRDP